MRYRKQLPRLPPEFYRGRSYVFWTYPLDKQATGWLSDGFHATFREGLLHTLARYRLCCLVYVLMPDHMHFIWAGASPDSDQLKASAFFRKFLNPCLAPRRLQRQPHDHVLREDERQAGRLADTLDYIRNNPVRAGLVDQPEAWKYVDAMVPGYPNLGWATDGFRDRFFRCFQAYTRDLERRRVG